MVLIILFKWLLSCLDCSNTTRTTYNHLKRIISTNYCTHTVVDCFWDVMAHAQKPDFIFRRNGRVHLSRRGRQFSLLLAADVCASAVVMQDIPCSEVVWRVLAIHSILQFPIHFPFRALPCAITFQLESTSWWWGLDTPKTCTGWRNTLRISCASIWFFFTRLALVVDYL